MPLQIIRQDITKLTCDAIVNATNSTLRPGGGLDAAIHAAAGPRLAAALRRRKRCPTGRAVATKGYGLRCKYIIHTVGPVWTDGRHGEPALLASCYRSALELARQKGCASIAFPLISAGAFGCPGDLALREAVGAIGAYLLEQEMTVYLVVFGPADYRAGSRLFAGIQSFIDDNYAEARADRNGRSAYMGVDADGETTSVELFAAEACAPVCMPVPPAAEPAPRAPAAKARARGAKPLFSPAPAEAAAKAPAPPLPASLREALRTLDESFSQALLRMIDERGLTDAQCYKKANIDRKLFSKIRGDAHYRPSKPTALAFAIALELSLPETAAFLQKAGYALSRSSKFDVIIEYFIQTGNYNIFEINEALFAFDQSLLGD